MNCGQVVWLTTYGIDRGFWFEPDLVGLNSNYFSAQAVVNLRVVGAISSSDNLVALTYVRVRTCVCVCD